MFYLQIHCLHFASNVRLRSDERNLASWLGPDLHARVEGLRRHHRLDRLHLRHIQEISRKRTLEQFIICFTESFLFEKTLCYSHQKRHFKSWWIIKIISRFISPSCALIHSSSFVSYILWCFPVFFLQDFFLFVKSFVKRPLHTTYRELLKRILQKCFLENVTADS